MVCLLFKLGAEHDIEVEFMVDRFNGDEERSYPRVNQELCTGTFSYDLVKNRSHSK